MPLDEVRNVCYQLLDEFFDRNFLVLCTWSGVSRGGVQKTVLKHFRSVLTVFFGIVHGLNPQFSRESFEKFLNSITKNAKKRSQCLGLRRSTGHRQQKKSKNGADDGSSHQCVGVKAEEYTRFDDFDTSTIEDYAAADDGDDHDDA